VATPSLLQGLRVVDSGGPDPVRVEELMSAGSTEEGQRARRQFIRTLHERGYAVVTTQGDPELRERIQTVFDSGDGYFAQDLEVKKFCGKVDISMRALNMGYVNVPGKREYIKLRTDDPEEMWPKTPEGFTDKFKALMEDFNKIVWVCFLELAKDGQAAQDAGEKEGDDGEKPPLLTEETMSAIEEFAGRKSSLSLIHYYKTPERPVKKDELEEEGDDKFCVCELHKDTGLMTIGVCSDIQGLQMYDRKLDVWMKVEALGSANDLVMFIGEKVPLFSGSKRYPAAPHRVMLPANTERSSMVFLLDVAK